MTTAASIKPYLNQAYLLGLLMVAVGLTLSPFLMGMSQFWLVIVWVLDGIIGRDFKQKFSQFWQNKAAVLLVAFYLMHVVGLLYTSDFQYAIKDLRVKLPILILPFIMASMQPLDRKRFDLVLIVYVLSVFVATWFSFTAYVRHDYEDVRDISRFISHIRFCLNIVFCIAVIGYCLFARKSPWWSKVVQVLLLLWFVYQIFILESLSGYVVLAAVVVVSACYAFLQWKKGRGWCVAVAVSAVVVLTAGTVALVRQIKPLLQVESVDFSTLDRETALGNAYWHDTVCYPVEDGKFVGLYYCKQEMQQAWPLRSNLPFEGETLSGENLEATLARYLTSKDLHKDAEGVAALTDEDIRNIEQGVANYNNWKHPGLRARLSATAFEYNIYRRSGNPNGGSLSQRIEFTRAAFHIIRQHPWFGVGTGDVPQAFRQAYDEIQSPLSEEFRFRAHNQYLSIMIAFGVVGLVVFLVALFYPYCSSKRNRGYLVTAFLCIMLLSMLPEDTLETQAGASMFAFFFAFLLFAKPTDRKDFPYVNLFQYLCAVKNEFLMRKEQFICPYMVYDNLDEMEALDVELLHRAHEATDRSYAPYSKFHVGAAVRMANGEIMTGSNIENAAYPSGLCAERVALFAAQAKFPGMAIEALAVVAHSETKTIVEPVAPCGGCRQVMVEVEQLSKRPLRVLCQGETGPIKVFDGMESLMPFCFQNRLL